MPQFFLGFDIGGTRSRARLVDAGGRVLAQVESGPGNLGLGRDPVRALLIETGMAALAQAGLAADAARETAMAAGIAGLSRPGARDALAAFDLPFASSAFASDGKIANIGAHRGEDGAILVIGTGSIAHVQTKGQSFSIGGYGFPISDEGSGAALGLSAVRHALRALDGRTRPTPLSSAVTAQFDHDTARVIDWMDTATPGDYASFAPLVMDFAEANDQIARSIVEDAAQHIERFIETIFQRGAPRCALAGGLAPRMQPWLRARTVDRLAAPLGDAIDGALWLAGYRPAATSA